MIQIVKGAPASATSIASFADGLLARKQVGGSDGAAGTTVGDMLASGAMRMTIIAGVLSLKDVDGTEVFTRTVSRTASLDAITSMVP